MRSTAVARPTDIMVASQESNDAEVLGVERPRLDAPFRRFGMVRGTYERGITVSRVPSNYGINPNRCCTARAPSSASAR